MAAQISEATVNEVVGLLEGRGVKGWRSIHWELQDDSEFLLVTIQLAEKPLERNAPERWYAYDVMDKRIPAKPDGDYSWMIVFVHDEDVCDSLMTGVA